jgi:hypothetical protein
VPLADVVQSCRLSEKRLAEPPDGGLEEITGSEQFGIGSTQC